MQEARTLEGTVAQEESLGLSLPLSPLKRKQTRQPRKPMDS